MSDTFSLDSPETIQLAIIPQPRHADEVSRPDDSDGPDLGLGSGVRPVGAPQARLGRAATAIPGAFVAFALGAYQIGARQLRTDESASWWAAHLSWGDLGQLLNHTDVVLAPYYVLLHAWVSFFGASTVSLRLPSLAATVVTAGLVALLGRRMFNAPTGLIGGLIFAVLPVTTRYAQDARPYALAALTAVVVMLYLYRALDDPGADRWGGYALAAVFVGLFHPVAAAVLLACFFLVLVTRRQRLGAWASVSLVPVAPVVALLFLGRGQTGQSSRAEVSWHALLHLPVDLLGSHRAAAAVGALALVGLAVGRRNVVPLLVWALLPSLCFLLAHVGANVFVTDYFFFTVPPLALLCAAGTSGVIRRLPGAARTLARRQLILGGVAVVAVLGVSFSTFTSLQRDPKAQPDYGSAAQAVRQEQRLGDGIVYSDLDGSARRTFAYQFLNDGQLPTDVSVSVSPQASGTYVGEPCTAPVVCASGLKRIWLLSNGAQADPYTGLPAMETTYLKQNFRPHGQTLAFSGGLTLTLLLRSTAAG